MKRWIERALNVRPGDLGRGSLLCACLFLVITSYKIGGVAGAALFLSRFQAKELAYAQIASAVLVALVIAGYVFIARRVLLRDLLIGSMVFFSTTCVVFWGLAHYYSHLIWVFPAFYVWVKIFGVLGATQIWTLANYVLTTREAKRVFGMVGGGGIAGWIFSGFLSKVMAKRIGTESLLLAMTLFVFICAGLVILVWRSGRVLVGDEQRTAGGPTETGPRNLSASLQLLFSSPYLRAIAAVICVGSLVTTLTDWQFLAIGQQVLVKKDVMAGFFGNFNFYAGLRSGAERLRPGAALFGGQVYGRAAVPADRRACEVTGEMVHRYGDLAHRRWAFRRNRPGFCHLPALPPSSNQLDRAAAGWRLAGGSFCGTATICRYPEGKH